MQIFLTVEHLCCKNSLPQHVWFREAFTKDVWPSSAQNRVIHAVCVLRIEVKTCCNLVAALRDDRSSLRESGRAHLTTHLGNIAWPTKWSNIFRSSHSWHWTSIRFAHLHPSHLLCAPNNNQSIKGFMRTAPISYCHFQFICWLVLLSIKCPDCQWMIAVRE